MKNIDWKLLKKQKETLCNVIHDNRHNKMISGDLDGILHLIDALQDEFEPKETEEQENARVENESLPSAMDYANYLHRACAKFKITVSEARSKYGQFTYKEWHNLLTEQETKPLPTTWDFVEKYYPNYSSSDDICRTLDLLLIAEKGEGLSIEHNEELTCLMKNIYEQAIENFIKINGGI